jgi:hypothetical protein
MRLGRAQGTHKLGQPNRIATFWPEGIGFSDHIPLNRIERNQVGRPIIERRRPHGDDIEKFNTCAHVFYVLIWFHGVKIEKFDMCLHISISVNWFTLTSIERE